MKISDVVTDTAKLYRRLFARSFLAALLIFLPFLPPFPQALIGSLVVQAIVTPFQAHALTALYYRLREPDRPVVPERPRRWESIWDEERERARRRRDDP